jgi:protein-tyrosine phosphatase
MARVLLVCMGNICRSPMARLVLLALAAASGAADTHQFDAAGSHPGPRSEPLDSRAAAVLQRRGYPVDKKLSRSIELSDFEAFDLILAMDGDNMAALQRMCPSFLGRKLHLFLSFAPGVQRQDVPDPYYGDEKGFEYVLDLCEQGAHGLLDALSSRKPECAIPAAQA